MSNFAVSFRGIDGRGRKRFSTLAKAAKYVKDRYLGSEYIRGKDGLQDEFGYYTFSGFTWADLGKYDFSNYDGWPEFRWFKEFGGDLDRNPAPAPATDLAPDNDPPPPAPEPAVNYDEIPF